jgi:hypothetical protein
MKTKQYMANVARTITTFGHRDNVHFMEAATLANKASQEAVVTMDTCNRCRNLISKGLESYVPGDVFFSPMVYNQVTHEYACL